MKVLCAALALVCAFSVDVQAGELKPHQGNPVPPTLSLPDLNGKTHSLKDYRGRIVLLNFWATWCPPCRAEMPSMWRLQQKLKGKPFSVVAVDMGETVAEVNAFLADKLKNDFVILMDTDGKALKDWKVFAFPTSYLIDQQGHIRYALFGETEWDTPEKVQLINDMLSAKVKEK